MALGCAAPGAAARSTALTSAQAGGRKGRSDPRQQTLTLYRGPGLQRADPVVFDFIAVPVR